MAELLTFGPQMVVLSMIVLLSLAGAMIMVGRRPWVFGLVSWATVMAAGAGLSIAVATLTRTAPDGRWVPRGTVHLHPFDTIRSYVGDPSALAFYVLGNVALFVPLGFFLFLALRRGVLLPAFLTVATSVGVEVFQLPIYSRSSDVDDVLLNSIGGVGGVVGAAVLLLVWRTVARFLPRATRPVTAAGAWEQALGQYDVPGVPGGPPTQGLRTQVIGRQGVGDRAS